MKVFQDPITGTYTREDGKPGYACARCGNGYATAETRDDTIAHGCTGFETDLASFVHAKGLFDEGYTDEDIAAITSDLRTVQFLCVWAYCDDLGFGGDSEIVGRDIAPDGSTGEWHRLDDTFWLYLHDAANPVTLDEVERFLDPDAVFETQNLTEFPTFTGLTDSVSFQARGNVAYDDKR